MSTTLQRWEKVTARDEGKPSSQELTELQVIEAVAGVSPAKAAEYREQVLKARGAGVGDNLTNVKMDIPEGGIAVEDRTTQADSTRVTTYLDEARRIAAQDKDVQAAATVVGMSSEELARKRYTGRSVYDPMTGVAYIGHSKAAEEELSHSINPNTNEGRLSSDAMQDKAMPSARALSLSSSAAYYGLGRRSERVNAMGMVKHVLMRKYKDILPNLKSADDIYNVLGMVEEALSDGEGAPEDLAPVQAILYTYEALRKMDPAKMTPEQKKAWDDLSSPDIWNQVANDDARKNTSREMMADAKGGDVQVTPSRGSIFSTDDVPSTIFGIPVVASKGLYTKADLRFFERHPEAGGYYDMGSGENVEDGSPEGAPAQGDKSGESAETTNRWGGNIRSDGRSLYFFRDDMGKITGYGTTESITVPGVGGQKGQYVVIPTIVDGRKLTDEQASAHYAESGEYWAARSTAKEANKVAQEVHEDHARTYGSQWNAYIESHPDELSGSLKAEIEKSKMQEMK